jgi:hypothetical protein
VLGQWHNVDQAGSRCGKIAALLSGQDTVDLMIVERGSVETERSGRIVDFAAAEKDKPAVAVELGNDAAHEMLCTEGRQTVKRDTAVDCGDALYTVTPATTASTLELEGVMGHEPVPNCGLLLSE